MRKIKLATDDNEGSKCYELHYQQAFGKVGNCNEARPADPKKKLATGCQFERYFVLDSLHASALTKK